MGISDDHDILTDNGWINISSINIDSYVATLNPLNGCIEYHKPISISNFNTIGQMYNIENDDINCCITLNQPIYVSKETNKWYLDSGSNLLNINTVNLTSKMLNKVANVANYTFHGTNKTIAMNKWLPLCGLFFRYGGVFNSSSKIISITTISIERLVSVVNGLNNELKNDVQLKILSYNIDSNGLATTLIKVPDFVFADLSANVPQWCYRLNAQQLVILLCDQYLPSNSVYSTENKILIDSLQALYLLAGQPFIVKQLQNGQYYLDEQGELTNTNQFSSEFVGIIYELRIQNFIFMVRKDDKPLWI